MLMKTNELSGAALDWAVAMADGLACGVLDRKRGIFGCVAHDRRQYVIGSIARETVSELLHARYYRPSTEWAQGGPLLDKFHVALDWNTCNDVDPDYDSEPWMAACGQRLTAYGPTALIAACRAIVSAKLGDEVEVPNELLSTP